MCNHVILFSCWKMIQHSISCSVYPAMIIEKLQQSTSYLLNNMISTEITTCPYWLCHRWQHGELRINGNLYKTADNQAVNKSSIIRTLNYYVLSRNGTTVFNNHLTAGRHTTNPSNAPPTISDKQTRIETTGEIISIRKKKMILWKKKRKMVERDFEI